MHKTQLTLVEQLRISTLDIEHRKVLFTLTQADIDLLTAFKPVILPELNAIVSRFYEMQLQISEIAVKIDDADTLARLHKTQYRYILDLFSGHYGADYVNNRLRIGLVHKRIGVDPKLYLSAIHLLKKLLLEFFRISIADRNQLGRTIAALEKLILFDISLVFDMYIHSLLSEIQAAREKSQQYANLMEIKVKERTKQLETLSRTDPLTGLLNKRHMQEILIQVLETAKQRHEPLTLVYFDVDDFKLINDTKGHQYGDNILRIVGNAIKKNSRFDDQSFRYGGDEFCVALVNATEQQAECYYGPRLLEEIHKSEPGLRLSIGYVQTGPDKYLSHDELIAKADQRMYEVKRASKACSRLSLSASAS